MTPQQRDALKQALEQHSLSMAVKDAAPEDVAALPQDFAVPTYNANNQPLYDNQLFPAVNSAEDLVARGYATSDGQVTERGQMALSLRRVGALNDDYTLNDTGKTLMASRDDLLKEENLPLYMKSKELELDDVGELSWGEVAGNFLSELKKGGKNLIDLAGYDTSSMTPEEKASFDLQAQSAVGGLVKAGTILPMGFSQIVGNATIKAISDNEEEEKLALAQFNQKFEKKSDEINNAKTAEVVDAMGQMLGAELGMAEARQQDIQTVGAERAQELESGGESAGGVAAMFTPGGPSMLTAKVAFGVAGKGLGAAFKPISRSLLQADAKAAMVLDKTKQLATLERQAGALQLTTQAAERQAAIGESMAQKFSQAGFTDRANNALRLANQARTKGQEAAVRLGGFTDEIAAVSDDLAKVTSDATVADKVLQMTQKASQMPYLPITGIGKALEYTGRGMIGIDKGLSTLAAKVGADKAYNAMNKITTLSGLGGVGVATGFGPAAFIPAAIKATWSTAPFIKATGEYVGLMGKEAMKARGQIGFWKRMYEMPNKGPMHRAVSGLMDTATLGGRVTGAAGRVGKGLAASYPVDLAFEWVAEGGEMNPNILKQAAVETLVFGGTGAALGGITMGSAERIRSLQNGDATNFYRSITDPSQRVMFNGMAPDLKRAIGTFSASNPGAKVEFVTQGEGVYDRNTKTVMVNPNARNPLKPLLTHEFMHHMLNNGIGDGVVAQLVGDGYQTGGILRSKDGGYEQQYEEFKSEYVNRLRQQHERNIKLRDAIGDPVSKSERAFQVPDEKYLAEEYFIETNVDDMLGLVESGKLGKMAGRMVLNDKVRALGDAILNKSAILRDLHFRIGGVMDKQGKMVKGNGFLGGQLYQSPEIRRMFNKMVNESVGRRGGIDAAKMKARNGIELPISGKNDPILGEMSSLWESDADGNPLIDKNGDYIPLSKQTDELRSQAGMLLVDDLRARQSRGEAIPDGELAYNPENNTWSGQYLNDRQIELLSLSGRFNSKQIKQLKLMNESARATSDPNADPAARGHRFSVIYQPALKKNRKGQWRYDQIKPQLRDVVPYGVEISKDGNILIRIMSTNQLFANASEKATSKRGRSLYDGNMDSILRDANAIIDLHGKNQATDAYFKDKYGAQWASHKEFINSVFGNVGKGHKDINPLVASDRVSAVVKSYRLDRMNKATQLVGATQLPYQNNLIKINYLPEGEPILDENGEPKDLRYTPSYEDSQVRMPEAQRAMPEGEQTPTRFMPEGVDEDKFYSQLERVITDKVPTRATAQQIMATIDPTRGSGVKADEIKWSGIEQALASLEKDGKVSKGDLLNYLRNEGRVRFEEVTLGKKDPVEKVGTTWRVTYPDGSYRGGFTTEAAAREAASFIGDGIGVAGDNTKFSQYVLPGGENYREVVLAMPKKSGYTLRNGRGDIVGTYKNREEALVELKQLKDSDYLANITPTDEVSGYTSSHFPDIPNYVAHMRTNERTLDGGSEGLFVEEFQSDRHQAGRKKGYRGEGTTLPQGWTVDEVPTYAYMGGPQTGTEWMVFDASKTQVGFGSKTREEAILSANSGDLQGSVPDAPFRTTWPIQLFKRALRDAVDGGKDWIGWTTGETQNDRFDLSKQVDSISVPMVNADGSRSVRIDPKDGTSFKMMVDSNGIVNGYQSADQFTGKRLDEVVGKDMADKIIALESPANFEGNDLKVGGSGMRGFYDNMLPKEVGKYVKQFGGRVEKADMTQSVEADIMSGEEAETGSIPIWKVNITPEMRKISQTGQMRFMPEAPKPWNPNPIKATSEIARQKNIPSAITDEVSTLIKNKPLSVGMADLLGAGGKIRGVDVSGGPGYPIQNFDPANPNNITAVWASERKGINTILQNLEKTNSIWQDDKGHNWALFAPHTMAQQAHKSNAQTPKVFISKVNEMASSGSLTRSAALSISDHIRQNVPEAKNMPNIGTEKLNKYIEDAPFETRAAIMNELSNVRSRDLGVPSPEAILTETRDPQYHGVEKNAITGIILIDVDRMAKKNSNGDWILRDDLSADDFNVPKHPSYSTIMPGRVLVHFDNPVPFRISTPDMISTMQTASPLSRIDYLLARMPKGKGIEFQKLTSDIISKINEAQKISGNVPYIREAVKAVTGNWRKFTSGASLKGLSELIGAIHRSPAKDSLTPYTLSELQKMIKDDKMEVHQLGDNDIWFGVKKSASGNELVSVVNNTGIPGMLNLIMQRALEVGVNKLDAYALPTPKTPNGLLPTLYKRYGWEEVERMPFDRQYLVERKEGETNADYEDRIAQKEAALKMFWTEQGWDGQSTPDVVFMTYEKGRKTAITIGEPESGLVRQRVEESGAASEATSGEVRGTGLAGGREQPAVGGSTKVDSGASEGVLPRGFDTIVQSLRSASPIQIETIGITDSERKQFFQKLGVK
jgi:hypothetical protein